MMRVEEVNRKVQEYESYVQDTLKSDLRQIEQTLERKLQDFNDWQNVKNSAKHWRFIKDLNIDAEVQVNVGCGVSAFAEVTEYDKMYIDVGLGILVEMDYEEADKYADIRLNLIKKEINHVRQLAVNVKVHIKLVLLAIHELQSTISNKKS